MRIVLIILILETALMGFFNLVQAESSKVVINEIAWMGTPTSFRDEWIELFNNSEKPVLLKGWTLKSEDGTLEIRLEGTISTGGFYLLERTDDNTLPGIKADLIYKGDLSNQGEKLELIDSGGRVMDQVDGSLGWTKGDNRTNQTMERKPGLNLWQDSQGPGGTPKAENSSGPKIEKIVTFQNQVKEKATSSHQNFPGSNSSLSIFIASLTALFSGGIILILKRKLNSS